MAAVDMALDIPETARAHCPAPARPIDLDRVSALACGDRQREADCLQVFARKARGCLADLAGEDRAAMKTAAGWLKLAADEIGAARVSAAAGRVVGAGADAGALAALGAAIIEAENFILKLCR